MKMFKAFTPVAVGFGLILFLFVGTRSQAAALSFDEVWALVLQHSPGREAQTKLIESEGEAVRRLGRHWLPKLSLQGRLLQTQDPGTVLFSKLAESSIVGSDFSPYGMNNPEWQTHGQVSLGATWMLFEGGAKGFELEARTHQESFKRTELREKLLQEFAGTVMSFGHWISTEATLLELTSLFEVVEGSIAKYQVGGKENPVGRSGLLALLSFKNQINATRLHQRTIQKSSLEDLKVRTHHSAELILEKKAPEEFFTKIHTLGLVDTKSKSQTPSQNEGGTPFSAQLARHQGASLQAVSQAERARFLPHIGLFADGNWSAGPVSSAAHGTFGAFLRWSLFDGTDLGRVQEARLGAAASEAMVRLAKEQQTIGLRQLEIQIESAKESLKIISSNEKLLDEQILISRKLFQNGLLNALQWVEVLSRRFEIVNEKNKVLMSLLALEGERLRQFPLDVEKIQLETNPHKENGRG